MIGFLFKMAEACDRKPYQNYKVGFKLCVVKAVNNGLSKQAASKKFQVPRRRIQEWCKQEESLLETARSAKRLKGGGRKVKCVDIEIELLQWLQERREQEIAVTGKSLRQAALRLHQIKGDPSFKASNMWFARFKKRHNLSSLRYVQRPGCTKYVDWDTTHPGRRDPAIDNTRAHSRLLPSVCTTEILSSGEAYDGEKKREGQGDFGSCTSSKAEGKVDVATSTTTRDSTVAAPDSLVQQNLSKHLIPPEKNSLHCVSSSKDQTMNRPAQSKRNMAQTYVVQNHHHHLFNNLSQLWKIGKLCDAAIGNGNATVMVHKIVLIALSPRLLVLTGEEAFKGNFFLVTLPKEVSEKALWVFANYMYDGILTLDNIIIEDMERIAKILSVQELLNLCDQYRKDYAVHLLKTPPTTASTDASEVHISYSDRIRNVQQSVPFNSDLSNNDSNVDFPLKIKQEPLDAMDMQDFQAHLDTIDSSSDLKISSACGSAVTYWTGNEVTSESPLLVGLESGIKTMKQESSSSKWFGHCEFSTAKTDVASQTIIPMIQSTAENQGKMSLMTVLKKHHLPSVAGTSNKTELVIVPRPNSSGTQVNVDFSGADCSSGINEAYVPYPVSLVSAQGQSIPLPLLESSSMNCDSKHKSKRQKLS